MKRRKHRTHRLSQDQLAGLIPTGPVNAHRSRRDDIAIETRAVSEAGTALVMGQVVNTAVRKLLQANQISLGEAHAAQLFKHDHDMAYASCINVLTSIQVDCVGSGSGGAMETKLFHATRYQRALAYLGPIFGKIAKAAILELHSSELQSSLSSVGASVLPSSPLREQQAAGKGALVMTIWMLGIFYGFRNAH